MKWRKVHAEGTLGRDNRWFRLHVISHLYWFLEFGGIRRRLAIPGQVHPWILNGIKKMSALTWHANNNHDLTCNDFNPTRFVYIIQRMRFSLSVSSVYLVRRKSAKKLYLSQICWCFGVGNWSIQRKWCSSKNKRCYKVWSQATQR